MNMFADRREQSNKWDTHLCPEIRKNVEQLVDDSHYLRVGRSTEDTYEVIDDNNNAVSLQFSGMFPQKLGSTWLTVQAGMCGNHTNRIKCPFLC